MPRATPQAGRPDFTTHLNYVDLLARLSVGLTVRCTEPPLLPVGSLPRIHDKLRLIDRTRDSIVDEKAIVDLDEDYSTAAVLWLPIKSYYLAYHLLCVIDFLLTGRDDRLRIGHAKCVDNFTAMLAMGKLAFSEPLLNQVFDQGILTFRATPGDNLRRSVSDDTLYQMLMKKIAKEKINDFRHKNDLTNLHNPGQKAKLAKFKANLKVSIFDFFYQMRIRLNYRDFAFIDDVSAADTKVYFTKYFESAGRFYRAFRDLERSLEEQLS